MLAECQCFTFGNRFEACWYDVVEELAYHSGCLVAQYNDCFRISFRKYRYASCMVRFEVVYHEIVRLPSVEGLPEVREPLVAAPHVHGVEHGRLFV